MKCPIAHGMTTRINNADGSVTIKCLMCPESITFDAQTVQDNTRPDRLPEMAVKHFKALREQERDQRQ